MMAFPHQAHCVISHVVKWSPMSVSGGASTLSAQGMLLSCLPHRIWTREVTNGTSSIFYISATHPSIFICLPRRIKSLNLPYYHTTRSSTASTASGIAIPQCEADTASRYGVNVSRLYARRCMELAAISAAMAATVVPSVADLEHGSYVAKPEEWGRVARGEGEEISEEFARGAGLANTRLARLWAAGTRLASLWFLASPLFILAPLAIISGPNSKLDDAAWEYALWSVDRAGPTYTKLAQWASTRTDLFPAEFVSRFSRLQNSTKGHSWKETELMLKQSLGEDYQQILQITNTDRPIGSGCIAQVYRGKLQQDTSVLPAGTEIAIKVQHPKIRRKVFVDFYILAKAASFVERIPFLNLDYLSVRDSVEQFRSIMLPQLDMRFEAQNLTRFRKDFVDDDKVAFPQPIHDLTSRDVLVESYMRGEPILNYLRPDRDMNDRRELARMGLEMAMKMIFLHDFVHGDLHPGNILVDKVPTTKWGKSKFLRLNIIDCGLVVEMGEKEHGDLVGILGAFIKRDGYLAGKLMVDTAKKCQASKLDVKLFCDGIQRICADDEGNNFLEKVGDYMADICHLACKHKVKLEASFINAALACEIMEGIASSLYPEMAVQSIALPMVLKAEVMHGIRSFKRPSFFS